MVRLLGAGLGSIERRIGLCLGILLGGCVPSKASKSAGQIGCTPDEITISNEQSHFGLVQSGSTWVAECYGRTFVCSQVNQSGRDKDLFDSLFASEQVTCHEAPESRDAELRRLVREAAAPERRNPTVGAAPSGAAGFAFGETVGDAQKRCEAAGHAWRTEGGKLGCSGPAAPLGIAASIELKFCGGRACWIAVEHVPRANWSDSSVTLKTNLEAKYGPAQTQSGAVPSSCRTEQAFTQCLDSRQLTLSYSWRWVGGESLEMNVGKPSASDNTAIRLIYRRPRVAANMTAL